MAADPDKASREGKQHEDRDAPFQYLNQQVNEHQAAGQPDGKKKERVGNYSNKYRPVGEPLGTEVHDFPQGGPGSKATRYGVYDVTLSSGWISVGADHDTAAFVVASIRTWWENREDHPVRRLAGFSSAPRAGVAMDIECGSGRLSWLVLLTGPD